MTTFKQCSAGGDSSYLQWTYGALSPEATTPVLRDIRNRLKDAERCDDSDAIEVLTELEGRELASIEKYRRENPERVAQIKKELDAAFPPRAPKAPPLPARTAK